MSGAHETDQPTGNNVFWGFLFLGFFLRKGMGREHIAFAETIVNYQRAILIGKKPCIKLFSDLKKKGIAILAICFLKINNPRFFFC